MRVDFMSPVQRVMASASHFGMTTYARSEVEKGKEERKAEQERRFQQREKYLESYQQQVEGQMIKSKALAQEAETHQYEAETQRKLQYAKEGLTPSGRKRRNAVQGIQEAFRDGQMNRNAYEGRVEAQRKFESGEIDLSSLRRV